MRRSLFWLVLLVISCTKEEILVPVYPRVTTSPIVVVDANGATFKASISVPGNQQIIGHGFVWQSGTLLQSSSLVDRIELGSLEGTAFEKHVGYGFFPGVSYIVKAFVRTSTNIVYGELVEFNDAGSTGPEIFSISPSTGTWGDTVLITGKNFTYNTTILTVQFSQAKAAVFSPTDTTIKAIVPIDFTDKTSTNITVSVGPQHQSSSVLFTMQPPQITSVTPQQGSSGTLVVVKGKHFHPLSNILTVAGNELTPEAVIGTQELRFRLPKMIPKGQVPIKIKSGTNSVEKANAFNRLGPIISAVSPNEAFYDDVITVTGENFGEPFSDNKIIAGSGAEIVSIKKGEIKFKLPGATTSIYNVIVDADGVSDTAIAVVKLKPPVVTSVSPNTAIWPGQKVTINGDYFPSYDYGFTVKFGDQISQLVATETKKIEVKLPAVREHVTPVIVDIFGQTASYPQISSPLATSIVPGANRTEAAAFGIATKGYLVSGGTGFNVETDDKVYEFDETTRTWKEKNDFPGGSRSGAAGFALNNKGYVFGGHMTDISRLREFWEYDANIDQWTRKNNLPFDGIRAFNINSQVYAASAFNSQTQDGNTGLWKYDPVADSWTEVARPPDSFAPRTDYVAVSFGNKLVIGITEFLNTRIIVYDASLDQWSDKGVTSLQLNSPFGFEYKGKALVFSNESVYQYDLITNTWTTLATGVFPGWLGGNPAMFKTTNMTHFGLSRYNYAYVENNLELKNLFFSFDGQYSGL